MRKSLTIFISIAVVLSVVAAAAGIAGKKNDPLVSLSYLTGTYTDSLVQKAQTQAKSTLNNILNKKGTQLEQVADSIPDTEEQMAEMVAGILSPGMNLQAVSVVSGSSLTMPTGTQFFVSSGSASLLTGSAVNLSVGSETKSSLKANNLYLIPESTTAKINMTSSGTLYIGGTYSISADGVRTVVYTAYADTLYSLGLFKGTEKGYELDRKSTRIEGLVMLIRLLGEEKSALAYTGKDPFTDVPSWADRYVAYAYYKGYTNGSSSTTFGTSNIMTGNQYMTFLLRALGYDDSKGDFNWSTAVNTATQKGMITASDKILINQSKYFYRDHIVYTSYKALLADLKSSKTTLADQLITKGIFTQSDFDKAKKLIK